MSARTLEVATPLGTYATPEEAAEVAHARRVALASAASG